MGLLFEVVSLTCEVPELIPGETRLNLTTESIQKLSL